MHSRSILAATGRSCALTRTAKTVLLSFSKNKSLEGTNTPTPVLKNQSVVQLPASTLLEAAAACPNAPGVCQKSRSDGTSKLQILRVKPLGIGACRNRHLFGRTSAKVQRDEPSRQTGGRSECCLVSGQHSGKSASQIDPCTLFRATEGLHSSYQERRKLVQPRTGLRTSVVTTHSIPRVFLRPPVYLRKWHKRVRCPQPRRCCP